MTARWRRIPHAETRLFGLLALVAATLIGHVTAGKVLVYFGLAVFVYRADLRTVLVWTLGLTLALDDPSGRPFHGMWTSPVQHLGPLWFDNISTVISFPLRLAPNLLVAGFAFYRALTRQTGRHMRREPRPQHIGIELRSSIAAAVVALVVWLAFGVFTQGDTQMAYYQSSAFLVIVFLLGATAMVTDGPFVRRLLRVLFVTAIYRAVLCWYVYWTKFHGLTEVVQHVTSHVDSVVWVLAMVYALAGFLEQPDRRTKLMFWLGSPILGFALIVNNRRLGWIIFLVCAVYIVFTSAGKARRRLSAVVPGVFPILALYGAVGWVAPPSRLFFPVQALRSVLSSEDSSSVTREIENFNVVFTLRNSLPGIGTGFGHSYTEVIRADDISQFFAQYQFLPHNSMLGLLLWAGPVGLGLILLPTSFALRSGHFVRTTSGERLDRLLGGMTAATVMAYYIQGWGDLGLQNTTLVVLVGILGGAAFGLDRRVVARRRGEPDGAGREPAMAAGT